MVNINTLQIGQAVILLTHVGEAACGDHPSLLYGKPNDILFIRQINHGVNVEFPIQVSHEGILTRSFGVKPNEIKIND